MAIHSYVYILTNITNRVLYVGVTNDLVKRIYQHKNKLIKGFSAKYHLNKLVYYEIFNDICEAIKREKQIKAGSRDKKLRLIEKTNPEFEDLYPQII
ncbi:GIY-YIG nuclease family protein [Candidatus Microgenomates bacterium]|nr:GIY-YIG nuclease family protein [Candidatus Microgenomates bacterium]